MKSIQELKEGIEGVFASGVNMILYLGVGDAAQRIYKRANFTDGATQAICQSYVAGVRHFFESEELTTLPLSAMDQRSDALLMYDLEEAPTEFAHLRSLQTDEEPEFFSFKDHSINDVKMIVIKIASAEKSVLFVKKFYPVSLVKRDQILIYKSNDRFSVFNDDILKISLGFEVVVMDDEFYINDFSKFEKAFYFVEIANRAMFAVAKKIMDWGIVEDLKGHLAACKVSKKSSLRTAQSGVFQLDSARVIAFAVEKQAKIGLKIVDGKIQLTSMDSINRLYKLLNDDYLTSGLTLFEYETLAKNKME